MEACSRLNGGAPGAVLYGAHVNDMRGHIGETVKPARLKLVHMYRCLQVDGLSMAARQQSGSFVKARLNTSPRARYACAAFESTA